MEHKTRRKRAAGERAVELLQKAFRGENLDFLRDKIDRLEPNKDGIIQEIILRAGTELFASIDSHQMFPRPGSPEWWDTVITQVGGILKSRTVCGLQGRTWIGDAFPALINPGHLPPNYRHTWLIRTRDIDSFRFLFDGLDLDWGNGDRLVVYNANLSVQERWVFSSMADIQNKAIPCNPTLIDQAPFIQFYLILETGPNVVARTFRLWGLEVMHPPKPAQAAWLDCDDLEYDDLKVAWIQAHTTDGKLVSLDKPWAKASTQLVEGPLPRLILDEGWYLLGKNINANPEEMKFQKFFSFVFYNERTSRLRAYLFNHDFDDAGVSGYTVTFSLWSDGGKKALEGAFFPVDPRPDQWSMVTIPITHSWRKGSWACVETPILYPMVKKLTGKANGPAGSEPASVAGQAPFLQSEEPEIYDSVYEDTTEGGSQNLQLRLTAQPFQQGIVDLDVFGTAVGNAIQDGGGSSQIVGLLKKGKSAVDAFSMGRSAYEWVSKNLAGVAGSGLISGMLAIGSTGWGAAFAVVGLVVALLSSDESLRLSVELAIRAQALGTVVIKGTEYEHEFYLPGKFNLQEAHADGLQKGSIPDTMARYDRPLGNFGLRYNPGLLGLPCAIRGFDNTGQVSTIFPAKTVQQDNQPKAVGEFRLPSWLPIIVNPFADVVPFIPKVVDGDANLNQALTYYECQYGHVPWFSFIQDISPKNFITPEPDDKTFPQGTKLGQGTHLFVQVYGPSDKSKFYLQEATWLPETCNPYIADPIGMPWAMAQTFTPYDVRDNTPGLWLEVPPVKFSRNLSTMQVIQDPIVPGTYSSFIQVKNLFTHTFWEPIYSVCDDETGGFDKGAWQAWFPFLARKNADQGSVPLTAMYCQEQKYYYYGRTRKQASQVILEEYSLPICARVQLNLLDWTVVSYTVSGGGG